MQRKEKSSRLELQHKNALRLSKLKRQQLQKQWLLRSHPKKQKWQKFRLLKLQEPERQNKWQPDKKLL
jgi:hypothetical protein